MDQKPLEERFSVLRMESKDLGTEGMMDFAHKGNKGRTEAEKFDVF